MIHDDILVYALPNLPPGELQFVPSKPRSSSSTLRPRFVASGDVDALDGTRVMLVQGARYELGTAEPEEPCWTNEG